MPNLETPIEEVKGFYFSHWMTLLYKSLPRAKPDTAMVMRKGAFKLIKRAVNRPRYL